MSFNQPTSWSPHTSQGNFFVGACHWSISQNTIAHENTSTLWLYFGCACHSSGACQLTVPTRLRTIERVDCLTLARPKSAIFAVPFAVMRIFDDLQSRWMMDGFLVCRYSKPLAISSIIDSYSVALASHQNQGSISNKLTTLCSEGALVCRT